MQTLATYPYLTIYLHPAGPTLELNWQGFATSQQFREAVEATLELATAHQIRGWISDDRQLGAVRPRDLDWGGALVIPHLAALGLQRFAQLESQEVLNRRTIDGAIQQITPSMPFELRRFTDLAEARAWAGEASA